MAGIHVSYKSVGITYNEDSNRWCVDDEKNGITLARASLEEAKKGVDAAFRKAKKSKSKPFEAWYAEGYGHSRWVKVMVTSFTDPDKYRYRDEAWITLPKVDGFKSSPKGRCKVLVSELFKVTKLNDSRIAKLQEFTKQISDLEKKSSVIREKLEPIPTPSLEESKDS